MGDIELPKPDTFEAARGLLDDLLRSHVAEFGPYDLDDDEPTTPIDRPILGDWELLSHWIDQQGEHHYTRICSSNLAPHSRMGLSTMFDNE